ncbi:MAG TPA: YbhB/YbcL family Raf kinase inhibitor-like protein [Bryobacteraceae bacterium]|nr:YbhB/YbcL family Raf kinase inhibitor-like protein [Bryobacteraceae bacterium]
MSFVRRNMRVALFVLPIVCLSPLAAQKPGRLEKPGFTLTSPDFPDGGVIPDKYTYAVKNFVSPKLEWSNVPEGTVSFALIFHDPDEAMNKKPEDVLHWLAFNIPGSTRELRGNFPPDPKLPNGTIQANSVRRKPGYMGPGADAPGPYHHYTFEIFALDTQLNLGPDATRANVLQAIDGHILAKAVLVGRFHL